MSVHNSCGRIYPGNRGYLHLNFGESSRSRYLRSFAYDVHAQAKLAHNESRNVN